MSLTLKWPISFDRWITNWVPLGHWTVVFQEQHLQAEMAVQVGQQATPQQAPAEIPGLHIASMAICGWPALIVLILTLPKLHLFVYLFLIAIKQRMT